MAVCGLIAILMLLQGCAGQLIDSLESRGVKSCVWWNSGVTGLRSVSATGGVSVQDCLAAPCQGR